MSLTNFPYGITSFGNVVFGEGGIGNVYFVCQTTNTTVRNELVRKFGGQKYDDGSSILHSTIQAALDATVAARNDYVIVMPDASDYDLTAALTLSKKSVHLIAAGGPSNGPGATNSVRLHQTTAATAVMTISGNAVEVAGFFIKGVADTTCIEISASAHACNVHHNFVGIATTSGSATAYGIHGTGESSNLIITDNFVTVYSPTASQTIGGGIVLDNGTRALVKNNIVTCGAFAQTLTVGISCGTGAGSLVIDNVLMEGTGPNGAGVFSKGITVASGGGAFGNKVAMATVANSINGGTADQCAVLNYESTNGGTLQDID